MTCSNGSVTLVLLARLNTVTRLPTGLISELPSGVNTTLPAMAGREVSASAAASEADGAEHGPRLYTEPQRLEKMKLDIVRRAALALA